MTSIGYRVANTFLRAFIAAVERIRKRRIEKRKRAAQSRSRSRT